MDKKKNKIGEFLKKWSVVIVTPLVLICTFKSCDTNKDLSRLRKEQKELKVTNDSLVSVIGQMNDEKITEKQVLDNMERVMLDFIIYEDELDKKKITISQIKDKIKSND